MERIHVDETDAVETRRRRSESTEPSGPEFAEGRAHVGNQAATAVLGGSVDRAVTRSQGSGPLDPEIGGSIAAARGGGQALDDDTRADMEGHLGADLSSVRVHADSQGDQLSRSVQAEAFTTGTDVFFTGGKYQPQSTDGRRLLAHELTHVVQQTSGETDGAGTVSHPDDSHEVEARSVGDSVASAPPISRQEEAPEEEVQASSDLGVSRQEEEEEEEVQASPDTSVMREEAEEEEEVQASPDTSVMREEAEEEEVAP